MSDAPEDRTPGSDPGSSESFSGTPVGGIHVAQAQVEQEAVVPLVRAQAPDPLVGRMIGGKYRVEAQIGTGAMGSVYRALQISLEKRIALKILHSHLRSDGNFVERFHREAKAASRLDHPNIVRVIDFGEDTSDDPVMNGRLFIAMELLEGRDLFQVIQDDFPLPRERTIEIMRQTLAAVASAHDVGIIHRDLKPENVMISVRTNDDGESIDFIKVCDFGIAKMTERDASDEESRKLSVHGLLVGTPEYMSPEQARGEKLDPRSDVYALGVVLYQMLVGRVPFEGTQPLDVALRHLADDPQPPRERVPDADATLEIVCLTAMSKARDKRYQSAREMRAVLRAALEGRPLSSASVNETGVFPSIPPMYTPPPPAMSDPRPSGGMPAAPDSLRISPEPLGRATSKATPLSTETDLLTPPPRPGSGRYLAVGFIAATLLAMAFVGWRTLGTPSRSSASGDTLSVTAAPLASPPSVASSPSTAVGGIQTSVHVAPAPTGHRLNVPNSGAGARVPPRWQRPAATATASPTASGIIRTFPTGAPSAPTTAAPPSPDPTAPDPH